MYGSHGSKRKPQFNEYNNPRANVALSSLSSEKKSIKGRGVDSSDSQEEILQPEHNQFVVVKHDFVSPLHPLPRYHRLAANILTRRCHTTRSTGHTPSIILTRQCLVPAGLFDRTSTLLYRNILFATPTLFIFLGQQPSMACINTGVRGGGVGVGWGGGHGNTGNIRGGGTGSAIYREKTDPVLAAIQNLKTTDSSSSFVMTTVDLVC